MESDVFSWVIWTWLSVPIPAELTLPAAPTLMDRGHTLWAGSRDTTGELPSIAAHDPGGSGSWVLLSPSEAAAMFGLPPAVSASPSTPHLRRCKGFTRAELAKDFPKTINNLFQGFPVLV